MPSVCTYSIAKCVHVQHTGKGSPQESFLIDVASYTCAALTVLSGRNVMRRWGDHSDADAGYTAEGLNQGAGAAYAEELCATATVPVGNGYDQHWVPGAGCT